MFIHYGIASGLGISSEERNMAVCPGVGFSFMVVINRPTEYTGHRNSGQELAHL